MAVIPGDGREAERMMQKNAELEIAIVRSLEREAEALRELDRVRDRLRATEEAEDRLCAQIGDLEAEAFDLARSYLLQIRSLVDQISRFREIPPLAACGKS